MLGRSREEKESLPFFHAHKEILEGSVLAREREVLILVQEIFFLSKIFSFPVRSLTNLQKRLLLRTCDFAFFFLVLRGQFSIPLQI